MKLAVVALTRGGSRLGLYLWERFCAAGGREWEQVNLFLPQKFFSETAAKLPVNCRVLSAAEFTRAGGVHFFEGPLRKLAAALFPEFQGFVLIMAAGVAVRIIAPLLRDKRSDPAVVVMDEKGRFAVSLLSGHLGGANELAKNAAAFCGAQAVITTATDVNRTLAVDLLAKKMGLTPEPFAGVKRINAASANGEKVAVFTDLNINHPALRAIQNAALFPLELVPAFFPVPGERKFWAVRADGLSFSGKPGERPAAAVFITNKAIDAFSLGNLPHVFLRPKNLVVGVGCKKGARPEQILEAVHFALAAARLAPASVRGLASVSRKQNEAGLLEAARRLGAEISFFSAAEVEACLKSGLFCESAQVKKAIGVGAVCEPAAWLAAEKPARMVVPKTVYNQVAVAVAQENCW